MPKAGCTSILWLLAQAAALPPSRFHASPRPQVSRSMTIHDMDCWPAGCHWRRLTEEQRARVESDDAWLRFTVVRDPARRLWSAWQDKLLMRQPDFVERFGVEDWFPSVPGSAAAVVADFRAFLHALARPLQRRPVDPHWTPQTVLLERAPALNHVGRVEDLATTLDVIGGRVGHHLVTGMPRANSGLLPFHPALLDAECRELLLQLHGDDYRTYGYHPPPVVDDLGDWPEQADSVLPLMREMVERHRRIADLDRALTAARAAR